MFTVYLVYKIRLILMTVFAFMVLQLEKHFSKTGLSLFECMI